MDRRNDDGDDAASIRTVLPVYGSEEATRGRRPDSPTPSYRTVRPDSPTPSYRTVDPNAAAPTQSTRRNPLRKLFSRQTSTNSAVTSGRVPPPQSASQSSEQASKQLQVLKPTPWSKWQPASRLSKQASKQEQPNRATPWTELQAAVRADRVDRVLSILSKQMYRGTISELHYEAAMYTATARNCGHVLEELIANASDYGVSPPPFRGLLDTAIVRYSNYVLLGLLKEVGPYHLNEALRTPVHLAATCGNDSLMLILKKGRRKSISINGRDKQGQSPLYLAAMSEPQNIDILLQFGADINLADNQGYTPLHRAAREDRSAVVEMLINRGADSARLDKRGYTALASALELATASSGRDIPKSRTLLALAKAARKETVDLPVGKGGSALHLAVKLGYPSVVDQLLSVGANAGVRSQAGETPLHYASRHCSARDAIEIAKSLIKAGLDADAQHNTTQRTALDVAVLRLDDSWEQLFDCEKQPWFDLMQILQQAGAHCTVPKKLDKLNDRYCAWRCDMAKQGKTKWLES